MKSLEAFKKVKHLVRRFPEKPRGLEKPRSLWKGKTASEEMRSLVLGTCADHLGGWVGPNHIS